VTVTLIEATADINEPAEITDARGTHASASRSVCAPRSTGLVGDLGTPIRLRRPPASEPPFDASPPVDLRSEAAGRQADQPAGSEPAGRADGFDRRPIGAATARAGAGAPARHVPPAVASAQRYVRICLEVLNGFRPAAHLRTLAGPVEFGAVVNQLNRRRNGRGHFPQVVVGAVPPSTPPNRRPTSAYVPGHVNVGARYELPSAPQRRPHAPTTAHRNAPGASQPVRLMRLRVAEPRDGIAEVVAVLAFAGASLAMAMRLERRDNQWLCAVAQVI
jgi:hypothetical protein